jgi:hypothetical protein
VEREIGYQPDMDTHLDLDDDALDRLLDAPGVEPSPAPALGRLLAAAAASRPGPVTGEGAAVEAFRRAVRRPVSGSHARPRRRRERRTVVQLAAAGVAAGVLAGGVAAATGSLPGTAQEGARDMLGRLGVTIPGPDGQAGEQPNQTGGVPAGIAEGSASGTGGPSDSGGRGAADVSPRTGGSGVGTPRSDSKPKAKPSKQRAVPGSRAAVPVPNHGVGNPDHPRRDDTKPVPVRDGSGGRGAGASSGGAGPPE